VTSPEPVWDPGRLLQSPFHAAVAPWLGRLPVARFPDLEDLRRLREEAALADLAAGLDRLAFVVAEARSAGAAAYERRIREAGEVATRPGSWHDLKRGKPWAPAKEG
jgi:hypothetical protein